MDRRTTQRPLDRRQRKSRDAIQNALLALLQDKQIDEITISELAIKADVNRKTFYNNYHSIQEVRDELDNRYLDMIFSLISGDDAESLRSNPEEFFLGIFRGLHENITQCRLIFDSGEHICLSQRLKEIMTPYLNRLAAENGRSAAYLPYILEFVVNGLSSVFDQWLHSSPMVSDEEMAHLAASLIRSTVDGLAL